MYWDVDGSMNRASPPCVPICCAGGDFRVLRLHKKLCIYCNEGMHPQEILLCVGAQIRNQLACPFLWLQSLTPAKPRIRRQPVAKGKINYSRT